MARRTREHTADTTHHGRFEKDGIERDAGTAADAVRLKFDGWKLIAPVSAPATPTE